MLESPTNPRMQVCDLQGLTDAAHEAGALVAVDNSIMTFLYQRPLDMGADISMTSATKFIGGHSDVMAGLLSVKDEKLAQRIYFHQVPQQPVHMSMADWREGSQGSALKLGSVAMYDRRVFQDEMGHFPAMT